MAASATSSATSFADLESRKSEARVQLNDECRDQLSRHFFLFTPGRFVLMEP
jgi:hypothetical protein